MEALVLIQSEVTFKNFSPTVVTVVLVPSHVFFVMCLSSSLPGSQPQSVVDYVSVIAVESGVRFLFAWKREIVFLT